MESTSTTVGTIDTLATNQICSISSRQAKGRRNMAANVSPASTTKSPIATAGFDQAAPVMVGDREIATPAYPFRREAYAHADDSGVIAAMCVHSCADPTAFPSSPSFRRTLRGHGLAVNLGLSTNLRVN